MLGVIVYSVVLLTTSYNRTLCFSSACVCKMKCAVLVDINVDCLYFGCASYLCEAAAQWLVSCLQAAQSLLLPAEGDSRTAPRMPRQDVTMLSVRIGSCLHHPAPHKTLPPCLTMPVYVWCSSARTLVLLGGSHLKWSGGSRQLTTATLQTTNKSTLLPRLTWQNMTFN